MNPAATHQYRILQKSILILLIILQKKREYSEKSMNEMLSQPTWLEVVKGCPRFRNMQKPA